MLHCGQNRQHGVDSCIRRASSLAAVVKSVHAHTADLIMSQNTACGAALEDYQLLKATDAL